MVKNPSKILIEVSAVLESIVDAYGLILDSYTATVLLDNNVYVYNLVVVP